MILDFLARSRFFLDFLARLIAKILARNLRNPRSWQQMKEKSKILARNSRLSTIIQGLVKKTKTPSTGQHWIRVVQKCSSLNQLWPEMSKLKSAGTALKIAENAKISESALKMTDYLWELNPGRVPEFLGVSRLLDFSINGVKCDRLDDFETIMWKHFFFVWRQS